MSATTYAERDAVVVELSHPQADVNADPTRFRVLIAGRRFGKTTLAGVELLQSGLESPGSVNWYVAPTRDMAKDLAWEPLKALAEPFTLGDPNESDLRIRLVNGSTIGLKSADKPKRLVGRGLTFVVLDEFAQISPEIWDQRLRPALSDKAGRALFISTPEGMNWAYELYRKGVERQPDWSAWSFTTIQGGRVPPDEVEKARRDLDPRLFRQEYEASFETLAGRVYSQFELKEPPAGNVSADVRDLPDRGLLVGMDFNVHPMTCVFAVQNGRFCDVFDAWEVPTSNTTEVAAAIRKRWPERAITICPDPSGGARKTSAAGETDFTILRRYGFTVDAPSSAPLVKDRVNAVEALLCNAAGERSLRVAPQAKPLITALLGLTYKLGVPDAKSPHIHITDALGYLVWQRFNRLRDAGFTHSRFIA